MLEIRTSGAIALLGVALWALLCWKHHRVARRWRGAVPNGAAPPGAEQTIREMIRHENELMNHRLTWLLTLEGLLFASLGFAWDKPGAFGLIYALSVVGMIVAASAAIVLDAAHTAFLELDGWWAAHRPSSYAGPDVCGFRGHTALFGFLSPWRVVPPLFIVGWFAIFYIYYIYAVGRAG